MHEPSENARSSAAPAEDQLNSWKDIAAYFGRDATTVQRWEKREGMPVHRHQHHKLGSVYAFRSELNAWSKSRNLKGSEEVSANGSLPASVVPLESVPSQASSKRTLFRTKPIVLTGIGIAVAIAAALLLRGTDYFWRDPIKGARFQPITEFDGVARDAALSRDGQLVAFLSDHDGQMDVWVSQIGSGQFHNLTHGRVANLVNPQVRTVDFSPDSSLVTFWVRRPGESKRGDISIWAVPTLGGQPRPYLDGVAELDWSGDGSHLAYHTPGPGDPLFVSDALKRSGTRLIFTAPAGLHSHFPLWSRDGKRVYFVQGSLPDKLDIWRITANGGPAERITSHSGYLSHPVLVDNRTLMYLAGDRDGLGPWPYGLDLYSVDVSRRIPHRLTSGPEHFTSLAASADGRRLALTVATPKRTLWRLSITDLPTKVSVPTPMNLTTSAGFFPRFGPNYVIYVSSTGGNTSIWKYADGIGTELWSASLARVLAAPAISADGQSIAFSIRQNGQTCLYIMQADGRNAHPVADSLNLQGEPAWAHDGRSIVSAVNENGVPRLFQIPLDGRAPIPLLKEYSVDPVWEREGRFIVYSGADIGTSFPLKAVNLNGGAHAIPAITLTRGARHLVFARAGRSLILLQGDMEHKDLWAVELETGAHRRLTAVPADFNIQDFDVSPDGKEIVLERVQERSDIVLLERR